MVPTTTDMVRGSVLTPECVADSPRTVWNQTGMWNIMIKNEALRANAYRLANPMLRCRPRRTGMVA
jgi:hypothetical protein